MPKSNRRKEQKVNQRAQRKVTAKYLAGGGQSKYARKRNYLSKRKLWGWEIPIEEKPWITKK